MIRWSDVRVASVRDGECGFGRFGLGDGCRVAGDLGLRRFWERGEEVLGVERGDRAGAGGGDRLAVGAGR